MIRFLSENAQAAVTNASVEIAISRAFFNSLLMSKCSPQKDKNEQSMRYVIFSNGRRFNPSNAENIEIAIIRNDHGGSSV